MTDKLREKAQQALGALEAAGYGNSYAAIELREALAEADIEEMTLTQIAARHEQAEQEPVAWMNTNGAVNKLRESGWALNAAAVRTKDLTDDEIVELIEKHWDLQRSLPDFARAVIAADREKNK